MSRMASRLVMLFLVLAVYQVKCKNVVFLPLFITSHTRAHAFVAEELARMGHNVWLGIPSALEKRNTETYKGVTTFRYGTFWDFSEDELVSDLEKTLIDAINADIDPDWEWVMESVDVISEEYFKGMKDRGFIEYIESLKPDFIVLDWNPYIDERVAIAYKLKVPFAVLSPLLDSVSGRIPINPVAEAYNSPYFRNHASLFQKVLMIIKIISPRFKHLFSDRGYINQLIPEDPNVPPANELMSQAEVYIVESDPIFDYPRPTLPNVKLVGGLSDVPAKPLQDPFKSFVERSEKAGVGVAVFSFGSLFMNLPKKIELKLLAALMRVKLNTIWRANITSPDPNKILTTTWLPLNDLLGHKSVKVFISHSGAHSLYEALYHGVPTVFLPIFFDQNYNAERGVDKGYGLSLDFVKATEDELVRIIEEVASNKTIRSTVNKASEIYRQLYKNPRQEAAFWLDHVMKYDGAYMRYSGQKIPMYIFILDYIIVFLIGLVFAMTILLLLYVLKRVFILCFRRNRHLKKD